MRKLYLLIVSFFLLLYPSYAQILNITPAFPTVEDTITVIYDASQGNGALVGVSPVYAHTGVITDQSTTPTDWQYVQGDWGTADANVLMEDLGNNLHKLRYHIRSYYGIPQGEVVESLAFVFRNADGTIVGRDTDGSDIFYEIATGAALEVSFIAPISFPLIQEINDVISVEAAASASSDISLYLDGTLLTQTNGTSLNYDITVANSGKQWVKIVADDGNTTVADSFHFIVNEPVVIQDPPAGALDGINYIDANTVILQLHAPQKQFVYVMGDFNNWELDNQYYMKRSNDGNTYWLEINNLNPGEEYSFQYYVDGEIKIADPYSEKILDPWNDTFIDDDTYPDLKEYPFGKTTEAVGIIQTDQIPYVWQTPNFQAPEKTDLVIYELLLRDFTDVHNYQSLIDSLDYLERLGVNAIELMPIMEFEGNSSWGYNPSFFFALDKYYGTKNKFKEFIDEAHSRGIAIILDIVLNHAFGQSPMARLYWDAANSQPAANNPWFNTIPKHPFNVGNDFNHESPETRAFMERLLAFWINEYNIDGYRVDLSKGLTQVNSGSNVGLWGAYDASRIDILKNYADVVWNANPNAYMILEHFADNSEETELANYGMMLWGNMVHNYSEATMGWIPDSDFQWISWKNRGWNDPHVIGYMESHDEERQMFKNLNFGNSAPGHDTQDLNTSLERSAMAAAFFFTVPGPKMLWQFGEYGYDISIDDPCRVCEKPILWNYLYNPNRYRLLKIYRALIHLKANNEAFRSSNFTMDVGGNIKRITILDPSMDVFVIGNFDVNGNTTNANYPSTGTWYDYLTGDSVEVTNTNATIFLNAGEYHVYTSKKLDTPDITATVSVEDAIENLFELTSFPNPFVDATTIQYTLPEAANVTLTVYDMMGRVINELMHTHQANGTYEVQWTGLDQQNRPVSNGLYFFRLTVDNRVETIQAVLQR